LVADVTDILHLNPTATRMAKMALDGVPLERARAILVGHYGRAVQKDLTAHLHEMYDLVGHLSDAEGGCVTCAIPSLRKAALFSTPVQAPLKADIAVTYGCNNACSHCYNEGDRFHMASLPLKQWRAVIDRLVEIGVPHLIMTGGEPTLSPDLPEIIHYADQRGPIVGMNTNGRRLGHRPFMETLVEAGLNHVQITLSSSRAQIHNLVQGAEAFEQTVRGIENALSSDAHTITNTTLMSINKGHAEEIIEFLYRLGIRTFAMNGMIYSGGGAKNPLAIPEEEMPPILLRVRRKAEELGMRFLWYTPTEYCRMSPVELEIGAKRCNAGEYSLCIEPNGDVLPCQSYYLSAGNILKDPWESIWNGDLFRSFRDREEDPQAAGLPEKCWDCPQLSICGGGCRIEREAREGIASHEGGGAAACGSGCCSTSGPATVPVETGFVGPVRKGRGETPPLELVESIVRDEDEVGIERAQSPGGRRP
jgi:radical SAM protein with 4Fe4S-binding SPASM domain